MTGYLTYYYNAEYEPFRCLSDLDDETALKYMKELYLRNGSNILYERFKEPENYLRLRRETEQWTRSAFIKKGGKPIEINPISMVLGKSKWIAENAPRNEKNGEITIPLSEFNENDISFTFPDSMVSRWLGNGKPAEYYLPEYHGILFTQKEILRIIESNGRPEEEWEIALPPNVGGYIEAQVWNRKPLQKYLKK